MDIANANNTTILAGKNIIDCSPLAISTASLPRSRYLHRENACSVRHPTAAANDDTAHGLAAFRVRLQRWIAHLLLDLKSPGLFLWTPGNCLVNVGGHTLRCLFGAIQPASPATGKQSMSLVAIYPQLTRRLGMVPSHARFKEFCWTPLQTV